MHWYSLSLRRDAWLFKETSKSWCLEKQKGQQKDQQSDAATAAGASTSTDIPFSLIPRQVRGWDERCKIIGGCYRVFTFHYAEL